MSNPVPTAKRATETRGVGKYKGFSWSACNLPSEMAATQRTIIPIVIKKNANSQKLLKQNKGNKNIGKNMTVHRGIHK